MGPAHFIFLPALATGLKERLTQLAQGPWHPALDKAQGLPGLAGQRAFHFHRSDRMYEFPVAAVTKYPKLGGLKHQKFILSQFWRPEI